MESRSTNPSYTELLLQDHYTVDELARLTEMSVHVIEQAAFAGELKAEIVDHHIVSISRQAAITWMDEVLKEEEG